VAAHVGRFVDEEGGPRAAPFQPREGARRARVENGDPHVGGNLVEAIAQRPVRIAVRPDEETLFVRMTGVIQQDLGPPASARRQAGSAGHADE